MQRIVVDIAWATLTVYVATVILREISLLSKDSFPSVSRAIEFGIGTGGVGAGSAG